eukprot:Sspe_Gene.38376::Locus_18497_Transcript_1_1_Confidence_1.000_Length_2593::g.38376::m.38376/K10738/MCM9; DNA helicase MCM9
MKKEQSKCTHPVSIDAVQLLNLEVKVGHMLLAYPDMVLPLAEQSAVVTQQSLKDHIDAAARSGQLSKLNIDNPEMYTVKTQVRARITSMPLVDEFYRPSITSLRTEDVGQMLAVRGTIIRESSVKMFEACTTYVCERCHGTKEGRKDVPSLSPAHGPGVSIRPPQCSSCGRQMVPAQARFKESVQLRDYQEVKLQDQVASLKAGTIPRSITVVLEDDLVESCKAGDDLIVTGILTQRWLKEPKPEQRCMIELVLRANYLRVTNEDKLALEVSEEDEVKFEEFWRKHERDRLVGRDHILAGLCPEVYGMHLVKLGIALVLIGGFEVRNQKDGSRTRGACHLLLVGDPGTAKSQFLQFAASLSPRSVCTTGIGTTSAGLTVSASKESGEWVLDAGALVIADGGVCCIDEFSTIPEQKHIAIHEAMEQQSISIAKAGLVTRLNTRCSVIAACNPKKDQNVSDGDTAIGIPTPLLSRFDLIMVLLDAHDESWDSRLASFLLAKAEEPHRKKKEQEESRGKDELVWNVPTLRSYFAWVRSRKQKAQQQSNFPPMADDAATLLHRYYSWQRENRNVANRSRRTLRMLESLIRLAEAHCLLVNAHRVELRDVVVAISLIENSSDRILSGGCDGMPSLEHGVLHTLPDEDPTAALNQTQNELVARVGLTNHPLFRGSSSGTPRPPYGPGQYPSDSKDPNDLLAALFQTRRTDKPPPAPTTETSSQRSLPSYWGGSQGRRDASPSPAPPLASQTPSLVQSALPSSQPSVVEASSQSRRPSAPDHIPPTPSLTPACTLVRSQPPQTPTTSARPALEMPPVTT